MCSGGLVEVACSHAIVYYGCCGCCSVGSWCLYSRYSWLLGVVGIGGVVVGIVDCCREVVALVGVGGSVWSTLCWWVTGVGVGCVVVYSECLDYVVMGAEFRPGRLVAGGFAVVLVVVWGAVSFLDGCQKTCVIG